VPTREPAFLRELAFEDLGTRDQMTGGPVEEQTMEERIRKRAYELWQQDGSMEGCADEYWRQARQIVEREMLEEKPKLPPQR
jgi:Protein of unknown function (DUF2934)